MDQKPSASKEDILAAATASTHNQYIPSRTKTGNKVVEQQPLSYFSQVCFDVISKKLIEDMNVFIKPDGTIKTDEIATYSENLTTVLWIAWVSMLTKKRFLITKAGTAAKVSIQKEKNVSDFFKPASLFN